MMSVIAIGKTRHCEEQQGILCDRKRDEAIS